MICIQGIDKFEQSHRPSVVTIGNFDGVHLGHQMVIKSLLEEADKRALPSTVVTFDPFVRQFFNPHDTICLTSIEQRVRLLGELGVDQVVVIPFDYKFAANSAEAFIDKVLINGLGVRFLSVGDDFRFGRDRHGDFALLEQYGAKHDFDVRAHDTLELGGARVSSGRIRDHLKAGQLQQVKQWMGRAYCLEGMVTQGDQLGRTLQFPTANMIVDPTVMLGVHGVYAVEVEIEGFEGRFRGATNVGKRPTVEGDVARVETHIFDFDADIYGKHIAVHFLQKIRDEQKFASVEQLRLQISQDIDAIKDFFVIKA